MSKDLLYELIEALTILPGVGPIGGELEYVDGNTIARAIQGRIEI